MTGMNRLSPWIVRRPVTVSRRPAATVAIARTDPFAAADPAAWLADLRLFATGWVGGLIFFGTLFG